MLFQDSYVFVLSLFLLLYVLLYQSSFVVIEVLENKVLVVRVLRIASSFISTLTRLKRPIEFLYFYEVLHCLLLIIFQSIVSVHEG
jgi:hypothetical protein